MRKTCKAAREFTLGDNTPFSLQTVSLDMTLLTDTNSVHMVEINEHIVDKKRQPGADRSLRISGRDNSHGPPIGGQGIESAVPHPLAVSRLP